MKNSEIIQYIDRFCAHNEDLDTCCNADLAFSILAHGYLYVRPGKPTEKFTLDVIEALKAGAIEGFNNYLGDEYSSWPLDVWIRISMARTALQVARKAFNKRFFNKQITCLDLDEVCDESLLGKYLNLMSKEQLLDFMRGISDHRAFHMAFTTIDYEIKITNELHELCYKRDSSIPEKAYGLEYLAFVENNPYYLADYLNNEEIVNAIKLEIVFNKSLAGHLARILYNTNDIGVMDYYVELIATYERVFRRDIYDPDILYETLFV